MPWATPARPPLSCKFDKCLGFRDFIGIVGFRDFIGIVGFRDFIGIV